jgi:hypothetical protein
VVEALSGKKNLGGGGIKWQNGTDQLIDTPTDRRIKEQGPCRPLPFGQRGVISGYMNLWCTICTTQIGLQGKRRSGFSEQLKQWSQCVEQKNCLCHPSTIRCIHVEQKAAVVASKKWKCWPSLSIYWMDCVDKHRFFSPISQLLISRMWSNLFVQTIHSS